MMDCITIPGLPFPAGRIALGCNRLGTDRKNDERILQTAIECGLNLLDTAATYGGGESETFLGKCLSSDRRDRLLIATKGGLSYVRGRPRFDAKRVRSDLENSLRRLRTDRVDAFLLHVDEPEQPIGPLIELLLAFHREGKILTAGLSNWRATRVREALKISADLGGPPLRFGSAQAGLAASLPKETFVTLGDCRQSEEARWYRESGLTLLAFCPLAMGAFSRRGFRWWKALASPYWRSHFFSLDNWRKANRASELAARKNLTAGQVALGYLLARAPQAIALCGCRTSKQVRESAVAGTIHLSESELRWLESGTVAQTL